LSKPYTFLVVPGVWCVMRRSYFTCSYLVVLQDGKLAAIDAGMKSTGSEMLSAIAEIGRTPADVRAILLTHWHNDHAAGAAELARQSGCDVFYSATEADHLTRRAASGGLRGKVSAFVPETGPLVLMKGLLGNAPQQAVEATQFVRGGESIIEEFEAIDSPGHTAGHLSFYHLPTQTLFAGDALAVINQRLRFMARPVTEDLPAARASMSRILDRPINAVCPGHREPLNHDVAAECERMRNLLQSGQKWPLLG
jgi:glyoxylase-like metal-dependent hydrolase (beta-lactamase superfamily II)